MSTGRSLRRGAAKMTPSETGYRKEQVPALDGDLHIEMMAEGRALWSGRVCVTFHKFSSAFLTREKVEKKHVSCSL